MALSMVLSTGGLLLSQCSSMMRQDPLLAYSSLGLYQLLPAGFLVSDLQE